MDPATTAAPLRKRVGVLTFHRCVNYGSYWQARCLVEGLRARGHDAVLLDHRSRPATWAEWRCAFQPTLPLKSRRSDYRHYGAKARRVLAAVDRLPRSAPFALEAPPRVDQDVIVVGSDEVWNLAHPWYGGQGLFFGDGLEDRRVVSYAASFGNYDAGAGLEPRWAGRLASFDAISVRDENSRRLVRGALGCDPQMVLDPVLQFPPSISTEPAEPGRSRGGRTSLSMAMGFPRGSLAAFGERPPTSACRWSASVTAMIGRTSSGSPPAPVSSRN